MCFVRWDEDLKGERKGPNKPTRQEQTWYHPSKEWYRAKGGG